MENQSLGKGYDSAGFPSSPSQGTSLIVQMFLSFAKGEIKMHKPANEFTTIAVETRGRYCLNCFTVTLFDVWHGIHDNLKFKIGRCRSCQNEVTL